MEKQLILKRFKELLSNIKIHKIEVDLKENEMIYLTVVSDDFKDMMTSDRIMMIAKEVVGFTYEMLGNHGLKIVALAVDEEKLRNLDNNCEKMEDTGDKIH